MRIHGRGVEQRRSSGSLTRRSSVQIRPPQPITMRYSLDGAGWGSTVARRALHNPKVVGSNPAPATNLMNTLTGVFVSVVWSQRQCGQHPTYPRNKLAVISGLTSSPASPHRQICAFNAYARIDSATCLTNVAVLSLRSSSMLLINAPSTRIDGISGAFNTANPACSTFVLCRS